MRGGVTQNDMTDITELAQYGLVGVIIGLILLIAYIVHMFMKMMGNHMDHNTEATDCLRKTMNELIIYLKTVNGK